MWLYVHLTEKGRIVNNLILLLTFKLTVISNMFAKVITNILKILRKII